MMKIKDEGKQKNDEKMMGEKRRKEEKQNK